MIQAIFILLLTLLWVGTSGWASDVKATVIGVTEDKATGLKLLVEQAYKSNPMILQAREESRAQQQLSVVASTPESPILGLSTLDRGNETQYMTISQKLKFPAKYYVDGKYEKSKTLSAKAMLRQVKWQIRQKVITAYYAIYSNQKRQGILSEQLRRVKEVSRVAEKKYAAGTSPQSHQMRAHMELAQLELKLLNLKKQELELQNDMRAIVHSPEMKPLQLQSLRLTNPAITGLQNLKLNDTQELNSSPYIAERLEQVEQAEWKKASAAWGYAPDIEVKLQERISGDPPESRIISVGVSVPLWFWSKNAQYQSAKAELYSKQYKYHHESHMLLASVAYRYRAKKGLWDHR